MVTEKEEARLAEAELTLDKGQCLGCLKGHELRRVPDGGGVDGMGGEPVVVKGFVAGYPELEG